MILTFIKKLDDLCLTIFSRMKVIYQILIIISLMVIFLTIQGYMGIGIIDNMQDVTNQVFSSSIQCNENINYIKNILTKLRINYLEAITMNPDADVTLESNTILNHINLLQSADPSAAFQFENELKEIKVILDSPKNETNYKELTKKLSAAQLYLGNIETAVRKSTMNSIGFGNQFSANSRRNTIVILIISTIIAVGVGFLIAASIARPLRAIIKATSSLATGDLAQNIMAKGCREAVSVVNELNRAMAGLRGLVQGVNENAELLAKSGFELQSAANDSGKSASEVARAMEEVARASSEQTLQINHAVERINLLSELVKKVSGDTEKIAAISEQMAGAAQLGQKVTKDVTSEFNELFNFTKEAAEVFNELRNASENIFEILNMIRGIAEQTTLLALNAAIEAARAGEQGKGFAVVATETGKLAEQSKEAAELITDIIMQIKGRTEQAVNIMEHGIAKAESGKKLAKEVTTTFEGIFQAIHQNLQQIETVAKLAREMTNNNEEVITSVSAIAAISEESMAGTEEVSATAEEQSALAQEVTALAANLSQMAEQMKQSVSVFEI